MLLSANEGESRPMRLQFALKLVCCPRAFFDDVYAAVRRSPLETNGSFHDISDIFQGYVGTLYIDYAHITERGNEIIARRMFQDVRPLVAREIARRQSQAGGLIQR